MNVEDVLKLLDERSALVKEQFRKIELWQDKHESEHKIDDKEKDKLLNKILMEIAQINKDKVKTEKDNDRKWGRLAWQITIVTSGLFE